MKYYVVVVVLMILFLIASAVAILVFGENLIFPDLPLPSDKARFFRYLSCAYTMCAEGCDSHAVIEVGKLDEEKGSCNKVCNEMGSGHLCGRDYQLVFGFKEETLINNDKPKEIFHTRVVETEIMHRERWYRDLHTDGQCYSGDFNFVEIEGMRNIPHGCIYTINPPWADYAAGLCEGTLRVGSGCISEDKCGNDASDCAVNTGHIWIDPLIAIDQDQCKKYNSPTSRPPYYHNCTFSKDQEIYIWTELDHRTPSMMYHESWCPELIICSTP